MRSLLVTAALIVATSCSSSPPSRPGAPAPATATPTVDTAPPVESRSVERVAVFIGRIGGGGTTVYHPDGTIELSYQHIENGRGPKLEGRLHVAGDGTVDAMTIKGTQTMGAAIDERFSFEDGVARWHSLSENGEAKPEAAALYVPIAPWPGTYEIVFDALQRNGGELALLPAGRATLTRAGEARVTAPDGSERALVAWNIAGLGFTPTTVWADADGGYFGTASEWFSYVPKGWDAVIPSLIATQKQLESARAAALVARLATRPPEAGLAIVGGNVLDVRRGRWLRDYTVVIRGDRITAVGPSRKLKAPAGARVIDARGKSVIPGLWDMHAHLDESDGILDLASGVTTARDLANDPDALDRIKARFDAGEAIGPHVLRSGFIEGRGPNAASSKIRAETEAEAIAAVDFYAARGYEGIKIYNSIKPELVPILTRLAHAKGMRVSGHVPAFMRAEDAVRAGYDEIQHINMLFLNFLVDDKTDTRTLARFTLVSEHGLEVDLDSKPVVEFLALLAKRKIVVDPTLAVFEWMFESRPGTIAPGFAPVADRLPVLVRRDLATGALAGDAEAARRNHEVYRHILRMVKRLHDRGIRTVAGTDFIPGLTLLRELALNVEAGIPAADVLRLATLGSAEVMKLDRETGSIDKGKVADLVIIDGDPLADIDDLGKTVTVIRGGVSYPTADLYREVGVQPR